MKCKKVLISLMLSLAMVFTALPAMAFAAPQEKVETKDAALNDKTATFDEILKQIDSLIGQADTWVDIAKTLDASTIRMGSYMAVESLKSYLESMLEEYSAKLAALLVEKADDIDEAIKMATAMYDEYKGAYVLLRQAYENSKPKIQNYLKLAAKTKGIKVKVVRKKGYTFVPIKLVTTDGERYLGKITYKGKFLNKKSKKALKFSTKTGKITVRKGAKKGTYKIRVTAKAGGDGNYMPCTLVNKTVKIKVR